ncbi:MAG: hypothetical protein J1E62_08895 [Lachnospiraceae bacterium]|nr:hypothetical protein [Lachnospiraceae bacterium]
MEDKLEEVLAQYTVQAGNRKRVRGAILLETEEGLCLLREFSGKRGHLEFEEALKNHLTEQGYSLVDRAVRNNRGELLTRDGAGGLWLMKQWFSGRECDLRDAGQVKQAMVHLAKLHQWMVQDESWEQREEMQLAAADLAREAEQGEENCDTQKPVSLPIARDFFGRRNRELKRVHTYIRNKRRKNEMELALLDAFSHYYEQGCEAQKLDVEEKNYEHLLKSACEEKRIIHGSYNYHNVLFHGKDIITTNFDNAKIGIQVLDLYGFLRKVMEKNGWRQELGMQLIEAYRKQRKLSTEECHLLYTLLLYPEKYWKQCNFYYNGKKSWVSGKSYEKLLRIRKQESGRLQFLEMTKGLLF